MPSEFYIYLILGALAGGFINGLSGMGTALFALGFFLVVLDPIQAVAVVTLLSVLAGVQGVWIVRRHIFTKPGRLARYIVPGLIGVPLGLSLLQLIDGRTMRIAISVLLIIYGGYFGFRTALPAFARKTPILDSCIGLIGGVMGGAAGVSGAIPGMWMSLRPWTKFETRSVLQPFNMALLSTTVILLALKGAYDATTLKAFFVTVPVGLIAAQIGITVFKAIGDQTFRRLLILLTLAMGLGILVSELL
jgi:uncharacterized membrane protein YfcA